MRIIRSYFASIIESAKKEINVETARKIQALADNSAQIIKLDLTSLNRAFAEKVDRYLSVSARDHGLSDTRSVSAGSNGASNAEESTLRDRIDELEMVHKQQAILLQKLRAELEFYTTTMDDQAEIDNGLCLLVEKFMKDTDSKCEVDAGVLEQLNAIVESENRP